MNQSEKVACAECAAKTSRREFLTASAASAVVAVLAACGGSGDSSTLTGPVSLSVQVSSYPALANVGGLARVDNGGTPVAAARTTADTFAAFSLICPHMGCTVDISGAAFVCPCHGARFASSGAWTGGQRTSNLRSLTTSYDSSTGILTITS
jgi:cytochrome b6-f complex iron-sulfur subunit